MSSTSPAPSGPSNPPSQPSPPSRQATVLAWIGGVSAIIATLLSIGATIYQSGKHSERMDTLAEKIQEIEKIGENYREIQSGVATLKAGLEEQRTSIEDVSAMEQAGDAEFNAYSVAANNTFDEFQDILERVEIRVNEIERISPIEQKCIELMDEGIRYSAFTVRGALPDNNPHIVNFKAFGCGEFIAEN